VGVGDTAGSSANEATRCSPTVSREPSRSAPHLQAVRRERLAVHDQPAGLSPALDGNEGAAPPTRGTWHQVDPVVVDDPVHLAHRTGRRIDLEDHEGALVARLRHEHRRRTLDPLHVRQVLELTVPAPVDVDHRAVEGDDAEPDDGVGRACRRIPDRPRRRPRLDG
jgi:hypothetical protein